MALKRGDLMTWIAELALLAAILFFIWWISYDYIHILRGIMRMPAV